MSIKSRPFLQLQGGRKKRLRGSISDESASKIRPPTRRYHGGGVRQCPRSASVCVWRAVRGEELRRRSELDHWQPHRHFCLEVCFEKRSSSNIFHCNVFVYGQRQAQVNKRTDSGAAQGRKVKRTRGNSGAMAFSFCFRGEQDCGTSCETIQRGSWRSDGAGRE